MKLHCAVATIYDQQSKLYRLEDNIGKHLLLICGLYQARLTGLKMASVSTLMHINLCNHELTVAKEEKLLKPGKTYTVGRAKHGQSLVDRLNVDNKAVSHEHLDIIVGPYELDDVVCQVIYMWRVET